MHKYENKRISTQNNKEQESITHNHHVYELQNLKDEENARNNGENTRNRQKQLTYFARKAPKRLDNPQILLSDFLYCFCCFQAAGNLLNARTSFLLPFDASKLKNMKCLMQELMKTCV